MKNMFRPMLLASLAAAVLIGAGAGKHKGEMS
jgi:hypothetical protein